MEGRGIGVKGPAAGQGDVLLLGGHRHLVPVSYTHLTLPTSGLVENSVVAGSLKKKNKRTSLRVLVTHNQRDREHQRYKDGTKQQNMSTK